MSAYKLNGSNMSELNPGTPQVTRAVKTVYKEGTWKLKLNNGMITIPCNITYTSKEDLITKLNAIDAYLQNGWLYIDNHKYNAKLLSGIDVDTHFDSFSLIFSTDEFEYEVYPYVATSAYSPDISSKYDPLSSYNFTGTMNPVEVDLCDIEIDPTKDNIITGEFAAVDGTIYASYIPDGYTLDSANNEIYKKEDVSI